METSTEQPLPLRRSKRRASVISPIKGTTDAILSIISTPTRSRASKRVRFSDSELFCASSAALNTGLTPAIQKASLETPKARRSSTPGKSEFPGSIQFTPFRQVIEDRSKRRIRRSGLSEVMNDYETEKRTKQNLERQIMEKDQELTVLKEELRKAKQANHDLRSDDDSQSRIDEVEQELEILRQSFGLEKSASEEWNHVPRCSAGPGSEGGDTICIYEDGDDEGAQNQDYSDAVAMGLELESARQAKQSFLQSSQGHSTSTSNLKFQDSPIKRAPMSPSKAPATPRAMLHDISKQLKAATSRAEDAELALQALEGEVRALGFAQDGETDVSSSLTALANQFRRMRIDLERLIPGETTVGFNNPALLPEIMSKLKMLSQQLTNREAELKTMRDQQRSLKGNFEHAIIAAEKANARIKELEVAIDQSAEETLNARMRAQALEKDIAEKDSSISSLVTALNKYRNEVSRLESLISQVEKDQLVALEEVKQATRHELEDQLSIMDAKVAAEERGRRAAEESAVNRLSKINELETALSTARQRAETVEEQLINFEQKVTSVSTKNEENFGALSSRLSVLATALTSANMEIEKLQLINAKLEERYRTEVEHGEQAVERMQHEMIRSVAKINEQRKSYLRGSKVRLGNWDLESDDLLMDETGLPMTPASTVRFADTDDSGVDNNSTDDNDDHVPGSVEIIRGRKNHRQFSTPRPGLKKGRRRRYDSGIGMDSLSENEEENENNQGLITPDLSSEADTEMDAETNETIAV